MDPSSNQVLQSPSRREPVPLCVQPNASTSDAAANVANLANVANENEANGSSLIDLDHIGVIPLNVQILPVGNDGRNVLLNEIHNLDDEEGQPDNDFENLWCDKNLTRKLILLLMVYLVLVGLTILIVSMRYFRDSGALPLLDVQEQQPTMHDEHVDAAYGTGDKAEDLFTGIKLTGSKD